MAGLDNLEIVVDIVDSFSDEINELLADLEQVDIAAERVENLRINLSVFGEREISELQTELASLRDRMVNVDVDVDGLEQLGQLSALKHAATRDTEADVDIDVDGQAQLAAAVAQMTTLKTLSAGDADLDFGDMDLSDFGRVGGPARGDKAGSALALSMSNLHNILATLIPVLLVYVGALPAVIGGVVALGAAAVSAAAALAALGGLAGLGFALVEGEGDAMQGLSEIADRIQSDFMDAFEPLARQLAPLFEEGLAGLERFFDSLASHGDILVDLQDEARAAGAWMAEFAVGSAASMGQLAEASAPLFGIFAQIIEDMNLLEGAAGFLATVLPELMAFGAALGDIIVNLLQMSVGFLTVATIITQFLDALLFVISGMGMFEQQTGAVIGALLALLTVASILYNLMASDFLTALGANIIKLYQMGAASIWAAGKQKILAAATTVASLSMMQFLAIAAATVGVLGGLLAIGGLISSQFLDTSSAIDEATKSLEEFQNVQGDLDGAGGVGSNVYQFNPTTRRSVINAPDAQTANRISNRERFKSDDLTMTR